MAESQKNLADLPPSDMRRVHLTDLENSVELLAEVRTNLTLAYRRDLAQKITPIIRAVRATIRRQYARGLRPALKNGEMLIGNTVYPLRPSR